MWQVSKRAACDVCSSGVTQCAGCGRMCKIIPMISGGVTVGALVEWQPLYARGLMRGRVTRIVDGRVYLIIQRHDRHADEREVWFDAHEAHRLVPVPA